MNLTAIATLRHRNQHIAGSKWQTVQEVVEWMGAMQAQDYAMAKWAVGVRLPNSTERSVEMALTAGDVLRTHVLRPTWHLVSSTDIYWLLTLTAPQIKASLKSRHAALGLSAREVDKSNRLIEKMLQGGQQLTRAELIAEFKKAKMTTADNRASHLFLWAEVEGLVCSGAAQTYALLEERVPPMRSLPRPEALACLAQRYFASHGPATIQDFVWWSGLTVRDAKLALEMVRSGLLSETCDGQIYWWAPASFTSQAERTHVDLLPAFDEFIISYTDRRASLPLEKHRQAVSSNGIFRPMIAVNGQVRGLWKRAIKKDTVILEIEFFTSPTRATKNAVEQAAAHYGDFLEKKIAIAYKR